MHAPGAVAYADSVELDQHSAAAAVRHRRRSVPFLIVSPLIVAFFLVAAVLTAVVVMVALAVYLAALAGAVGWGLLGPSPIGLTQRQPFRRAIEGLNEWISGTQQDDARS